MDALPDYRPADRYAERVDCYVRYRPSYPREAVDTIVRACGLREGSVVAELGSGTGVFSRLLLERGVHVHAVEPSPQMRAAAEQWLGLDPRFHSIAGSAEATTLPDRSMDAVVAAQAFHWFDAARVVPEIERVLGPSGAVALVWNNRLTDGDAFHIELECALRAGCPDYTRFSVADYVVSHERLAAIFPRRRVVEHSLANAKRLDADGLRGLISSLSFSPPRGSAAYAALMPALTALVDRHARGGEVEVRYRVQLFCIGGAA